MRLGLFGNDFLNRAEYFAQRGPRPYDTAFHRLLLSVFESGLRDYLKAPKYRGDVRQWVNERGGFAPFGFESACEYLGLNCAAAREAMRKWMKKLIPASGMGASRDTQRGFIETGRVQRISTEGGPMESLQIRTLPISGSRWTFARKFVSGGADMNSFVRR